jgi:hypothetical protein
MAGKPKHGDSYPIRHPLYEAWRNMNRRCDNPNSPQYKDWGGRGITVCNEWKKDYLAFKEWALANEYREGLCLDREYNDGPYAPDNCRWVTHKVNSRNTRTNKFITAFGEEKTLAEWADDPRCKVKYNTLVHRILSGWKSEMAINQGVQ